MDKEVHTFLKEISLKENVIERLEFLLTYFKSTVLHFSHCAMRTSPGITMVLFILSFQTTIRYSMQTNTLNNCSMKIFKEKRPTLVNRRNIEVLHDNARLYSTKNHVGKNIWFRLVYSTHPPYSADLVQSDFHLFQSIQNALNNKNLF